MMPLSSSLTRMATSRRHSLMRVGYLSLATTLVLGLGCGDSQTEPLQTTGVQADPGGEFEWAMTRLERALRLFRPNSAEGLVTKRDLKYEWFPPTDATPNFTARVTVVSETSFLHGRRERVEKEEKPSEKKAAKLDDPLAPKEDGYAEFVDIPGVGPGAPSAPPTRISTRSLDEESVFEMAYVDGKWELTEQPKLKHEQLWFEYAFQ
ncbi:MAG: hypothetical protein ACR2NM_15715 [Bythopirellula sp.]